jgi:hypothetical protein
MGNQPSQGYQTLTEAQQYPQYSNQPQSSKQMQQGPYKAQNLPQKNPNTNQTQYQPNQQLIQQKSSSSSRIEVLLTQLRQRINN